MADSFLTINQPETNDVDGKIDSTSVTQDGGDVVDRERMHIGGAAANDLADVSATFGLEVEVTQVRPPTGFNGDQITNLGTTPVELTFTGTTKVISIHSASTNSGIVWFGPATIDNTGANAIGELTPNASVEIELDDVSAPIYIVSDTVSQKAYKAALT